jgi:hypothetical protein
MSERAHSPEARLRAALGVSKSLVVSDLSLNGIDLSRRAIIGIEFRRCEFVNSNFKESDLSLTRFLDCDLYSANFTESVLYTTWFYECNLTKADLSEAYLLGLRMRGTDITKTIFDDVPLIGLERKSLDHPLPAGLQIPLLGALPAPARELETSYSGIGMARFDRFITFIKETGSSAPRTKIRAAETSKYLWKVHIDNAYEEKARHYYIIERRLRRQALAGSSQFRLRQTQDYVFGDVIWRYGTSVIRPIGALILLAVTSTSISYLAPLINPTAGIRPSGSTITYGFSGWNARSLSNFFNVGYFYVTAPAGGSSASPSGWVKLIFVIYILLALWLIALVFDAFIRRTGTSQ